MKVNGRMICNTVLVLKLGLMALGMKETIRRAGKMVLALMNGTTALNTQVTGLRIRLAE